MWKFSIVALYFFVAGCFVCSRPIDRHIIDMSYPFNNETIYFPVYTAFHLEEKTIPLLEVEDDRYLIKFEEFTIGTHIGTHMDAPTHFVKNSWSLDDIPMSRLLRVPAAVVDVSEKVEANRDYGVTVEDLMHWENTTNVLLKDLVLLLRTGNGKNWPNREAYTGTAEMDSSKLHFPGLSAEAAQWLVDNRSIYGVGIDTLSFDTGNSHEFPAHKIILGANIYGLENVANMDKLPIYGATLYILPMKMAAASGAATRIVATFPKIMF